MMAKQSIIEARKAQALEEINMRLARIEEKLGIVDVPAEPAPSEEPAPEEGAAEAEPEAPAKASRKKA